MALIKCPECGKEISEKSAICIHCGYPVSSPKTTVKKKNTLENKKRLLVGVVAVVVVITGVIFAVNKISTIREAREYQAQLEAEQARLETERQEYQSMLAASKENITPYLEYVGEYMSMDETLSIPSALYKNLENVEFMGMKGEIEFGIVKKNSKSKYVKYCSWTSFDGLSEEEFQEIASKLNDYFGCKADIEARDYSKGHTYRYYWVDSDNELCVTCGHGLFSYLPDGGIEIIWADEFCEGLDFYGIDY